MDSKENGAAGGPKAGDPGGFADGGREASSADTPLSIEERVNAALDKVRPGIQMDGGEVWLLKVENGTAFVQMLGACGGCPASNMTLKGAIEVVVCADVPEITEVIQV